MADVSRRAQFASGIGENGNSDSSAENGDAAPGPSVLVKATPSTDNGNASSWDEDTPDQASLVAAFMFPQTQLRQGTTEDSNGSQALSSNAVAAELFKPLEDSFSGDLVLLNTAVISGTGHVTAADLACDSPHALHHTAHKPDSQKENIPKKTTTPTTHKPAFLSSSATNTPTKDSRAQSATTPLRTVDVRVSKAAASRHNPRLLPLSQSNNDNTPHLQSSPALSSSTPSKATISDLRRALPYHPPNVPEATRAKVGPPLSEDDMRTFTTAQPGQSRKAPTTPTTALRPPPVQAQVRPSTPSQDSFTRLTVGEERAVWLKSRDTVNARIHITKWTKDNDIGYDDDRGRARGLRTPSPRRTASPPKTPSSPAKKANVGDSPRSPIPPRKTPHGRNTLGDHNAGPTTPKTTSPVRRQKEKADPFTPTKKGKEKQRQDDEEFSSQFSQLSVGRPTADDVRTAACGPSSSRVSPAKILVASTPTGSSGNSDPSRSIGFDFGAPPPEVPDTQSSASDSHRPRGRSPSPISYVTDEPQTPPNQGLLGHSRNPNVGPALEITPTQPSEITSQDPQVLANRARFTHSTDTGGVPVVGASVLTGRRLDFGQGTRDSGRVASIPAPPLLPPVQRMGAGPPPIRFVTAGKLRPNMLGRMDVDEVVDGSSQGRPELSVGSRSSPAKPSPRKSRSRSPNRSGNTSPRIPHAPSTSPEKPLSKRTFRELEEGTASTDLVGAVNQALAEDPDSDEESLHVSPKRRKSDGSGNGSPVTYGSKAKRRRKMSIDLEPTPSASIRRPASTRKPVDRSPTSVRSGTRGAGSSARRRVAVVSPQPPEESSENEVEMEMEMAGEDSPIKAPPPSRPRGPTTPVTSNFTKGKRPRPASSAKKEKPSQSDKRRKISKGTQRISLPNRISRVVARWAQEKAYYPGRVVGRRSDSKFNIQFDDGDFAEVDLGKMRRGDMQVGDLVSVTGPKAKWQKAKVVDVDDWNEDGNWTLQVQFDEEDEPVACASTGFKITDRDVEAHFGDRKLEVDDIMIEDDEVAMPDVPQPGPSRPRRSGAAAAPTPSGPTPARQGRRSSTRARSVVPGLRKVFESFAFVITLITNSKETTEEIKGNLQQDIESHGGSVYEQWHELYDLDKHGQGKGGIRWKGSSGASNVLLLASAPSKTTKYLTALALGIPCVHTQWITDRLQGHDVPWTSYLLNAGHSEYLKADVSQFVDPAWGTEPGLAQDPFQSQVIRRPWSDCKVLCVWPKHRTPRPQESPDKTWSFPAIMCAMGAASVEVQGDMRKLSKPINYYDIVIAEPDKYEQLEGTPGMKSLGTVAWFKQCLIHGAMIPI